MNTRDTVAPIPIELLKEYFSDDSIVFNIDYEKSLLKGDKIITYLSNLDVPCKLTGFDNVSLEDKMSLVRDYMNSNLIINSNELEVCVLKILHNAAIYDFVRRYDVQDILDEKEIEIFCEKNKEIIHKWLVMLASCSVYAIYSIEDFKDKVKEEFETIDDYDYCGVNFVQLFKYEDTQVLLTNQDLNVYYFEKQFNEPMFKGANIFYYWQTEENTMAIMAWGISTGEIKHGEFYSAIEKGYENVSAF